MSKVWSGVGAWALDAERAEAEERERAAMEEEEELPSASPLLAGDSAQSFPSLKEATSAKQPKKKKKAVAIPLSQFATGSYSSGGRAPRFESKGLTPDEMLRLPTGPRERSQEELEHGRLGGGFRSYGAGGPRGGFPSRRPDDDEGSWGTTEGGRRGYGGTDMEPRRGPPARVSDFDQPSRADEVDNWGAGKKPVAPPPSYSGRLDRYSSLGIGSSSRADDVDSWSASKKPFASDYPSFGSGRRDSHVPADSDRWVRGMAGPLADNGERQKLILDPPKREAEAPSEPIRARPSPFGNARPREEVLAEKGLDWRRMDVEIDIKKTSRPTSSHSSRPSSAQSSRPGSPALPVVVSSDVAPRPRAKVNPFGDAKPREVLLQEKGMDWRKIDMELEHRSVDRPETDEEKLLKEEISHLKVQAAGTKDHISAEELTRLHQEIASKERDLELLTPQFDDKVKFGQKAIGNVRPGSTSSRSDTSSTRALTQSGMSEEFRNVEIIDRPRSRGGRGDAWIKPMDDRRGFQRSRERGFFDSRNVGRSSSREGW